MKLRAVHLSGWVAFGALLVGVLIERHRSVDLPAFAKWLSENDGLAAWVGVVLTATAVFAAAELAKRQMWQQQHSDDAKRMTAIYQIARTAAAEIMMYDRLVRDAATDPDAGRKGKLRDDDQRQRARFPKRWASVIPYRFDGLIALLGSYAPTGAETSEYLVNLLTVKGRLCWLKEHAAEHIAAGTLAPDDKALLEEAAAEVLAVMIGTGDRSSLREELNKVRSIAKLAELPPMPADRLIPSEPSAYVLSKPHYLETWERAREM